MAWMLSIKYFVIFTQISRFSLNWRAHLQNGDILYYLFYARSMPLRFVLHPFVFFSVLWCMAWMLSIKYFVFFNSNFKIFPKLTDASPKWRLLWYLFYVRSITTKVCITSVCIFFNSLCMAWVLSIKYFVFFAEIIKNFSKLTNTSPKWRFIFGIFILRQINAPKVCITSVCVFISSLCMAWMLSIKYFVFFTQILRFSLNWRTHLQNDVIFGIFILPQSQCPKA